MSPLLLAFLLSRLDLHTVPWVPCYVESLYIDQPHSIAGQIAHSFKYSLITLDEAWSQAYLLPDTDSAALFEKRSLLCWLQGFSS